jgi:hypothetical protein
MKIRTTASLASATMALALAFAAPLSQAAVVNSTYTSLGGNSWLAELSVMNDGTPASFAGFTVDFLNATNLVLLASPATWDSAVFQADPILADPGFFDTFAISSANYLTRGQSQGGFRVSFTYTGGTPGAMPFTVNDANFAPLASGLTTTVAAIPEPSTVLLTAFGLAAIGWRAARTGAKKRNTTNEVTA